MNTYKVGDRVTLTDPQGRSWSGAVTSIRENGGVTVKWDSGTTELLHPSELRPDAGPEKEDPKAEGYHSRMAALWDSRPGK